MTEEGGASLENPRDESEHREIAEPEVARYVLVRCLTETFAIAAAGSVTAPGSL